MKNSRSNAPSEMPFSEQLKWQGRWLAFWACWVPIGFVIAVLFLGCGSPTEPDGECYKTIDNTGHPVWVCRTTHPCTPHADPSEITLDDRCAEEGY